ncbi:hypothetical protein QN277_021269 [Acacia crassicarpa]|uniref:Inhibitor I9 domain-containing protein n=1 Tax=Acacia crassicarpa TaxID=499986 RepID=A0AAE1JLE7_9FABA|nr:hypothetical protein QN277_021269 [Acacia crassicarpa]
MGHLPEEAPITYDDLESKHHSLLETAIGDHQLTRASKIHSYSRSFNAYGARLLPHEAEKLKEEEGLVSVFPNKAKTTHNKVMGFCGNAPPGIETPHIESNIIVGMLDSGIYIDSPSFDDDGYGPPPSSWKGKCVKGVNFTAGCNKYCFSPNKYNRIFTCIIL